MTFNREYMMGAGDRLERKPISRPHSVDASMELYFRLISRAVEVAYRDFSLRILGAAAELPSGFVVQVASSLANAKKLGLFAEGGVREDDFINLRCLTEVLGSTTYIESGVFIGSSLFAAHVNPRITRIVAIDPNMQKLKFRDSSPGRTRYVDDQDFGDLEIGGDLTTSLAYFDDHICTTKRLHQAHRLGIRHLCFDDSTGVHGITQRLYPATPTIGMLQNIDCLRVGDSLTWTFNRERRRRWWRGLPGAKVETIELRLVITEDLVEEMLEASKLVELVVPLPLLTEMVPLASNAKMVDRTKYYVRLRGDNSAA